MSFKKNLNRKTGQLILAGIFSLTLSACGGGGSSTPADGSGDDTPDNIDTSDTGVVTGSPQVIGSVLMPVPVSGGGLIPLLDRNIAAGVAVSGNHAYVAAGSSGLQVVDVSNKSTPTVVAENNTISPRGSVSFSDLDSNILYVAGGLTGVHMVELITPTIPDVIKTLDATGVGHNTFDAKNLPGTSTVCSADGLAGIQIYAGITEITLSSAPESVHGVAVSGDYCFATGALGGTQGLYVVDLSTPTSPAIVKKLDLGGLPSGIAIAGNYAYIVAGNPGMYVVDISDPLNPFIAGQTEGLPTTGPIAVDATRMRAYLGTVDTAGFPEDGMKIIDISNADAPVVIATTDLPERTGGVFAQDGYVYATTTPALLNGDAMLHIIDVSAY